MNIQHYCYTRGVNVDYSDFSKPRNISEKDIDAIRNRILAIMGDNVEKNTSKPKWVLMKKREYIIWGICCENKYLTDTDMYKDKKNRPILGFFAVVISEYEKEKVKLPFDDRYFKQLYKEEVEAEWKQRESHYSQAGYIKGDYLYTKAEYNEVTKHLNTNKFKCRSLGNVDKGKAVAAALDFDEISLLVGNDNMAQAMNEKMGTFMNCLSENIPYKECNVKQGGSIYPSEEQHTCIAKPIKIHVKPHEDSEVEKLNKKIQKSENELSEQRKSLESIEQQLKRQNKLVKIFITVTIVLLIVSLYLVKDKFFSSENDKPKENTEEKTTTLTNEQEESKSENIEETSCKPSNSEEKVGTHNDKGQGDMEEPSEHENAKKKSK